VIQSKGENVSNGFNKQQEQELVDYYGGPIFVQYFPASQKPFYMRFNDKGEVSLISRHKIVFLGRMLRFTVSINW
jgi:aspartyl/asparaginyl-tRNA synthetase